MSRLGIETSAFRCWKMNRSGSGPAWKAAWSRKGLGVGTSIFRWFDGAWLPQGVIFVGPRVHESRNLRRADLEVESLMGASLFAKECGR